MRHLEKVRNLNGRGELACFEARGIREGTAREAGVSYETGAFAYPCKNRDGELLGIHYKGEARDERGKRRQWWGGFAADLPRKGHGKKPQAPAKIVPFGLETLGGKRPGSGVLLCCGEEDALSLRQAGYTAVSQPGAGLLEPAYARDFAGLEVVVFYDAGEEREARKDATTLEGAGADVRVAEWPSGAPHGADINGRLVEDPEGFGEWVSGMVVGAEPLPSAAPAAERTGEPDRYSSFVPFVNFVRGTTPWPVLADEARQGLPGDIVAAIEPHTEADPVAVLVNLLVAMGNAVGRGAFFRVGADTHHLKLNAGIVGETSKGRKGTSWGHPRGLMRAVDEEWVEGRVLHGLSSGEGLIFAVRDRLEGEDKKGESVVLDPGVEDKRLLVLESELAGVLKVMSREGNTLSPVVRQAWDDGTLQTLTKNSPMTATSAHVSIIGHITKSELLRHLTETEAANGFDNRFIWLMVKRSKELPFGGDWHKVDVTPLVRRLCSALEFGKAPVEVTWGDSAREAWREVYGPLSEGKPGLFGAAVGRAEAQVMRLAATYAVMDESHKIEHAHLLAALALWEYAEASARYIFGDATGDPIADQIDEALKAADRDGMTRTDISHLLGRNKSADRINSALALLLQIGRVRRETQDTGGRKAERWYTK